MKKQHRSPIAATLLTTALLGLGALPALAEDFKSDIQSGDSFTLTVSPYPAPQELDTSNPAFFVGLTQGVLTDNRTGLSGDAFWMFCVDFNDEISHVPIQYQVVIQSLVGTPGVTPEPDPIPGLNESLATLQLQSLLGDDFGATPTGNASFDAEVQHDIWNQDTPPSTFPADNHNQLVTAQNEFTAGADYSGAFLLDVINAGIPADSPGQAFMVDTSGFNNSLSNTPEPGTWAMLGVGLLGLGSLKLRRSKR